MDFDKVLGLNLSEIKKTKVPEKIQELVKEREQCREQKNYKKADEIRKRIKKQGYIIEDTDKGTKIKKV